MRTLYKIRFGWSVCIFALTVVCFSCVETVENQTLVYSNNFSTVDLAGFENARLFVWRNDTIAGYYHNEEVAVTIGNLPTHNYLKVSVEVLIHDSWDGNVDDGLSGPDYWFMGIDKTETYRTTFSNTPCAPTYCLHQSYPNSFFRQNRPKTGAVDVNMPGLCLFGRTDNYTTRYVVEQLIEHSRSEVRLFMGDELKQTNSPNPICDESWSIASIRVSAIQTNN